MFFLFYILKAFTFCFNDSFANYTQSGSWSSFRSGDWEDIYIFSTADAIIQSDFKIVAEHFLCPVTNPNPSG